MLSTKDVKTTGEGGTPKTISPGNHTLKVNSVELKQYPFMESDNAYYLHLNVETAPLGEGFEGFWIDVDDESKGRYEGQVGQLKANRWYYKDGETKSGVPVSRDTEILKFIKNFCEETKCMKWFESVDDKYETIEEFVEAFNEAMPWKNTMIECCVAGKEYNKNNGYTGFDLFLPKFNRGWKPFKLVGSNTKLIEYNEDDHFIAVAPPQPVEGFGDDTLMEKVSKSPEFDL